jgi:predicted DCC family thiol-disulfide oxidoreductase YuxK
MIKPMDTLFYDGRCPLCMREVRLLRKLAGNTLALVDLHQVPDRPDAPSKLIKLTSLHLQTDNGTWLTGVDATVRAWSHTRWGWLFAILRWPLIGWVADHVYRTWALHRYRRIYGCADCSDN